MKSIAYFGEKENENELLTIPGKTDIITGREMLV